MRITHFNKRYWPHIGGVERVLHVLARACARNGDEVTALVCAAGPRTERRSVEGVEVVGAPTFGVVQSQPLAPSYLRLPNLADQVLHLHEPFPLGTLALLLNAPHRSDLPLVVTWHSDVIRQRLLRPVHVALARMLLDRARYIHVPTEAHIANSKVLPRFLDKIRPIPFIVDVEAMRRQPDHPLALALRVWARDSAVAVFVGRLVYYKGVDVLLDATNRTRKIRLVIVGDGPLRKSLEARAAELRISDRIRWLGTVSDADLLGAMSAGDLFVLPSVARSEAFGLVQVEAMAAGLPVISTRLGTSVEVVNVHGKSGFVVAANDARELAEAMQTFVDDASLRSRLAAGALQRAQDFAEDRLIALYRELYADARSS